MKKKKWGRIINIASAHAKVGSANKSAYVAAKHGVVELVVMDEHACQRHHVVAAAAFAAISDDAVAVAGIHDVAGYFAGFRAVHIYRGNRCPRTAEVAEPGVPEAIAQNVCMLQ